MSRNIPFQIKGRCIDCGDKHRRDPHSWRCWTCDNAVNKFRRQAAALIVKLIKAGELQRADSQLCVDCEKPAYDYDHRDYRKLLDVQPVCRKCNQRRGPAAWRNYSEGPATPASEEA